MQEDNTSVRGPFMFFSFRKVRLYKVVFQRGEKNNKSKIIEYVYIETSIFHYFPIGC